MHMIFKMLPFFAVVLIGAGAAQAQVSSGSPSGSKTSVGTSKGPTTTCVANQRRCDAGYTLTVLGKNSLGCPVTACMPVCTKLMQVPRCRDGKQPQVTGMDKANCPIVKCVRPSVTGQ